jgi:chemotaxis protein CheZ
MLRSPFKRQQAITVANQADQIQQAICSALRADLADLRSFIDRRIAELSSELHATVELMDFSETNLTGQLTAIRQQITGIISLPSAATRNSGLELEAVVEATDRAANRILEAAEAIGDWASKGRKDPAAMEELETHVNAIFEACAFQDLTGQRIRRTIQHLQQVESMLSDLMPHAPGMPEAEKVVVSAPLIRPLQTAARAAGNPDLGQGAIDSLFD